MLRSSGWLFLLLWLTSSALSAQQVYLANTEVRVVREPDTGAIHSLTIQLPASYYQADHFNHRYPVIYLPGGVEDLLLVSAVSRAGIMTGQLPEAILVALSVESASQTSDKRADTRQSFGYQRLLNSLEQRIMPFIQRSYRADAAQSLLVGHGQSGHLAAYILLSRPTLFSGYLLASPDLWYEEGLVLDMARDFAAKQDAIQARVFVGVGSLETPLHQQGAPNRVGDAIILRTRLAAWRYEAFDLKLSIFEGAMYESALSLAVTRGLYWLFDKPAS